MWSRRACNRTASLRVLFFWCCGFFMLKLNGVSGVRASFIFYFFFDLFDYKMLFFENRCRRI